MKKCDLQDIIAEIGNTYDSSEEIFFTKPDRRVPSRNAIIAILKDMRNIMFPGYFTDGAQTTADEADNEVRALLSTCYEEAKRILLDNRGLLDEIALYLLEKETITGDDLMAYVNADANRLPAGEENTEA